MSFSALLFVVGFASGCFLALRKHPIFGLLTYVGTFYVHPPSRWWGKGWMFDVRWALIAAGVTLIALMLRNHRKPSIPISGHGVFWGLLVYCVWIIIQLSWALDPERQSALIELYIKFVLALTLIYFSVDSLKHLKLFMWSHVLGCFYLGWIAFTTYQGGRFEEFGGSNLSEANAAALTMVTAVLFGGSLFLSEDYKSKAVLLGLVAIIVNGIVTTISRSAFLAITAGGLAFNFFTPRRFSTRVRLLSVLAIVAFLMLTTPTYWMRIASIKYKGEQVAGMDTGGGRVEIMAAQLHMFEAHPLGCGNSCTEILSPSYLDAQHLSLQTGTRASHNTFLSLAVDQGVVGAVLYLGMLLWVLAKLWKLYRFWRGSEDPHATVLPALAGALAAMTIGDMFVPYVFYEVRYWFLAMLMVMLNLTSEVGRQRETGIVPASGGTVPPVRLTSLPGAGSSAPRSSVSSRRSEGVVRGRSQ